MTDTLAFEFRPFAEGAEAHVALMHDWLRRPHVAEWWDGAPSHEEIRDDYVLRAQVRPFVVYLDGEPMAFIQSYVAKDAGDGWWPDVRDPGVVGIDQFIAEPALVGRGVGTAMIRAFVARLFTDSGTTRVQTDPSPDNARAIRCYEKVGFRAEGVVDTPDGPALYMTLSRAAFNHAASPRSA